MRFFKYQYPGPDDQVVSVVISEDEIIKEYYPHWSSLMLKAGRRPDFKSCIEDWITEHWAWEISLEEYKNVNSNV